MAAFDAMADDVEIAGLDLATEERFLPLRARLGVEGFGINQLTLQPGQRMRIHRHAGQEEVYIVLDGVLTVVVEGEPRSIGVGELMRVAPSVRRQLVNLHRAPVTIVALGSHGIEHRARDAECFTTWEADDWGTPRDVPLPPDLPESELRD